MDEFTRDYRAMWKAARSIKNIDAMELIFDSLCNEVGIPDPEGNQAGSQAGKEAAERRNQSGKGPEAKKL